MLDVGKERVDEIASVSLLGKGAAVEVAYGPANNTSHDNGCDEA